MRTVPRASATLGVAVALLAGTATAAQADTAPAKPLVNPETGGRYAEYNGRTIDLSQGWQGAEICVEQSDTSFRCYDDEAGYRIAEGLATPTEGLSTKDASDCPGTYICLWGNKSFAGKRVQFKSLGAHYLSDVGFRNRANSFYNNRSRITALIDYISNSTQYIFANGYRAEGDLGNYYGDRPDWVGSWNNKIDTVTLTSEP